MENKRKQLFHRWRNTDHTALPHQIALFISILAMAWLGLIAWPEFHQKNLDHQVWIDHFVEQSKALEHFSSLINASRVVPQDPGLLATRPTHQTQLEQSLRSLKELFVRQTSQKSIDKIEKILNEQTNPINLEVWPPLTALYQDLDATLHQIAQAHLAGQREGTSFALSVFLSVTTLIVTNLIGWRHSVRLRASQQLAQRINHQLSKRDATHQSILQVSADAIIYIDEQGIIQEINPACCTLFGYQTHELLGANVSKLMPDEYARTHNSHIERYLATGQSDQIGSVREVPCLKRDGTHFIAELSLSEVIVDDKKFFTGVLRDSTERLHMSYALMVQKQMFEAVVDYSPDALVITDATNTIVRVNINFIKLFGYDMADIVGNSIEILYAKPKDFLRQQTARLEDDESLAAAVPVFYYRSREKRTFPAECIRISLANLNQCQQFCMLYVIRDIDKRLQIEQSLKASEAEAKRLALVASSTKNAVIITNPAYEVEWVNEAFTQLSGYRLSDVLHRQLCHVLHGAETDPAVVAQIQQAVGQRQGIRVELLNYHKNGGTFWVSRDVQPVFGDNQVLEHFVVVETDITQRKKQEYALNQFKSTLDLISDTVFVFNPEDLRFTYSNQGAQQQVGYRTEELLSMRLFDLNPEYDEVKFRLLIAPLLHQERSTIIFETQHQHKNGQLIPVEIALSYITPIGEPPRFVAIVRDIAERKQVEHRLRRNLDNLHIINRISSLRGQRLQERIEAALHQAATHLEMDLGILSQVEGSTYKVKYAITAPERDVAALKPANGQTFELEQTYCDLTLQSGQLTIINNMATSPHCGHACYRNFRFETFIGMPLLVENRVYGTLSFGRFTPRAQEFDAGEREFFQLLALWIISVLEIDLAMERVQASEERLTSSQNYAKIGTWDWDIQTGDLYWSQTIAPLFGYKNQELETTYANFLQAVHPEDRELVNQGVEDCIKHGKPYELEHRVIWPDGSIHWILERGDTKRDADNKPTHMLGVTMDINARKQTEIALQQANRDLATLSQGNEAVAHSETEEQLLEEICRILVQTSGNTLACVGLRHLDSDQIAPAAEYGYKSQKLNQFQSRWGLDFNCADSPVGRAIRSGIPQVINNMHDHVDFHPWQQHGAHTDYQSCIAVPMLAEGILIGVITAYSEKTTAYSQAQTSFYLRLATSVAYGLQKIRDRAARAKAEKNLILFRHIFEVTQQAIGVADHHGKLLYINEAHEQMHGYRLAEVAGKSFELFLLPQRAEEDKAMILQSIEEKASWTGLLPQKRKDGSEFISHSTIGIVTDNKNNIEYIFNILSDYTEELRHQEILTTAKEEAERANRAKSDFLSSMSHELRTPMNAILGFAQILEYDETLNADQQESLQEILKAGKHLLELINEILDLAKIEAGRIDLNLESVEIGALTAECLDLVEALAYKSGIQLIKTEFDTCYVQADRTRLKQVLLNLLSNAIKYNRPEGQVNVQIHCGQTVRLSVLDTGYGLTPDQVASVFEPFNRLNQEHSNKEGTGIGLAITRRLLEMMGGKIGVDSALGKGCEFWLELQPAGAMDSDQPKIAAEFLSLVQPQSITSHQILYIEDNLSNVKLVRAILARRPDLHLLTATAPRVGLALAAEHHPDLILLDVNMPELDGYEVLRRLRANDALCGIPVIAVTANAMSNDLEKGKAAGFSSYLTKPIDSNVFLQTIDHWLKKSSKPV